MMTRARYRKVFLFDHISWHRGLVNKISLAITAFLFTFSLSGQPPTGSRGGPIDGQNASANQGDWVQIDSVDLRYSYATEPLNSYRERRDPIDPLFHQYDPVRRTYFHNAHLGNLGSAHRKLFFQSETKKGLHSGMTQYDLYRLEPENFKFYNTDIPLAEITFSQGSRQVDGMVNARFGRNFTKGVAMSIDYTRYGQLGEFAFQRSRNTTLGAGVSYKAEDGKYDGYYGYISNSIVQENNGGVSDLAQLDSNLLLAALPVYLTRSASTEAATTVVRERGFFAYNHFHLLAAPDSNGVRASRFDINYNLGFSTYFYKFYDEHLSQTGSYYDGFLTDDRGVRSFMGYNKFKNEIGGKLFINENNTLSASLEHRYITLNQDPVEDKRNELYVNSTLNTQIKGIFGLSATGYLGLLDASANLGLNGRISLQHEKWGNVFGDLAIYQRRPYLIEESLFINGIPVYEYDLKNVNNNKIGVGFSNEKWNMEAGLNWWLLNNTVYFDTLKLPVQIENAISVRQIYLNKDFRFGNFSFRNRVAFQDFDESALALPSWIIQSGFSYYGRIFRDLLLFQTGVDFRITDGFNGVNYFPVSGQFHLDDSAEISSYPGLDYFITLQMKSLKVYFKMDNINGYFTEKHYFNVIDYPQFETYFRFGFNFQLYN